MKKKALAVAIASALAAPSAWAAVDTSGMQYTSASEGFYASIRGQLDFSSGDADADINGGSSRIGIRGTNDLGGGLEGFYQWELGVGIDDDTNIDELDQRLGLVGLRGNFGEVVVGSFWTADYSHTHGSTDVANVYSGYLNYSDQREGRSERSIQYTTPDLNGFQGAILVGMGNSDNDGNGDNGEDLDVWNLSGQYAIQGFTVGASYNVITEGINPTSLASDAQSALRMFDGSDAGTDPDFENAIVTANGSSDDLTSWTVRLGYSQDNWYVNGWYGEDSNSDAGSFAVDPGGDSVASCETGAVNSMGDGCEDGSAFTAAATDDDRTVSIGDTELFSVAAGVSIDKVNLYALYEVTESTGQAGGASVDLEDKYATVGVQYSLGAQSRVWIEYWSRDLDSNPAAEDVVNIGLRHDF